MRGHRQGERNEIDKRLWQTSLARPSSAKASLETGKGREAQIGGDTDSLIRRNLFQSSPVEKGIETGRLFIGHTSC